MELSKSKIVGDKTLKFQDKKWFKTLVAQYKSLFRTKENLEKAGKQVDSAVDTEYPLLY